MTQAREFRFDGWTLKCDSGDLVREGRTVRLRRQSQQVLEALLERPGEVVTREELIARLWPRGVVDFETGLNSAIRRLRRALADDAETPRYIETLPRRGYRFIGHVTVVREAGPGVPAPAARIHPGDAPAPRRRFAVAAIGAAIAVAVAGSVPVAIRHAPASNAAMTATPRNVQANEHYHLARYFLGRRGAGDLGRAQKNFEAAIALDPDFAEAYAGLASVYWLLTVEGLAPADVALARMRAAATRALALDPRLAEAHLRLALDARRSGQRDLYEAHFERAQQAEPGNALLLSIASSDALARGRLAEGVELAQRAVASEPLTLYYRYNLASALFLAGRYEEAERANLELLELDSSAGADIAAQVLVLEGRFAQALELAKDWPDGIAKFHIEALAYHGLRQRAEADAALAALISAARERDPLRIVEVYAYRGDTDAAFGWLATEADWYRDDESRAPLNLVPWALRMSPFVASLRGSPRWREVAGKLGDI